MSSNFDMGDLLAQAQQMQEQLMAAQQAAASQILEGQAGGGAVRIEVTGAGEFRSVSIDPAAVDPDGVDMLEDLVLAALHDASARIQELQAQTLGGFSGFGAFGDGEEGLPGLPGLPGA